jgi:hypothetical protein
MSFAIELTGNAMAFDIGQASQFAPAICSHKGRTHMVFVANNSSGDLLHADSRDGHNFVRRSNLGQSTKFAPTIDSDGTTLRVVFVSNNNNNDLLQCTYNDASDKWNPHTLLGEQALGAPILGRTPDHRLMLFFVANNSTHTLLVKDL